MRAKEQPDQAANPEGEENWIHYQSLVRYEAQGTSHDIASALANVVHQFQKRKIVSNLPDEIRQKDQ